MLPRPLAALTFAFLCLGPAHAQRSRAVAGPPNPRILRVQAGQLLRVDAPPGTLSGTIRAPLLTGGKTLGFSDLPQVEFDGTARRLTFRVPAREPGPLRIRFETGSAAAALHVFRVAPPNLYDGIRIDGKLDAFESALTDRGSVTGGGLVTLFDAVTGAVAGSSQLSCRIATDSMHLYLAVTWTDPTEDRDFDLNIDPAPQVDDQLSLEIDSDGDGMFTTGDDQKMVFSYATGSGYVDLVRTVTGTSDDVVADGAARMDYDAVAGAWTAEFLLPRVPDPALEDADLSPGTTPKFNLILFDGVGLAATAPRFGGLFGLTEPDSSGWGALPLPAPLPASYAPVATPSGGTLILISDHEDPEGELYEFDFATSSLVRLTTNTRTEDWVSVSPAGDFATYGSSPDRLDFLGYEIYRLDRSTGIETPLTTNALLDGHPAVSPDGSRIAYARLDPTSFEIHDMDSLGGGDLQITSNAFGDNDPEWAKDGTLVIKTKRWTGREQLARIDLFGSVLGRLSANSFSDHDPFVSADNLWVLFERFESSLDWTANFNVMASTPWSIRMVSLDGARKRLLVNDGLANWLPVEGPDGTVLYFKNTAFNGLEIRMTDRFGVDRGRFLRGQGHVRYMDWK